jgi:hypothetical protein
MASLADTPDLVGFFSYSRGDDEGSGGRLSKLRERIQEELRGQLGRTKIDFRLWQDKVSISQGELWEDNIKKAVAESVFFIPIITPTAVKSRYCKFEFETFLAREKELGRRNLVFPILYIPVPALMGDRWREDALLTIIGSRQYEQWQSLRHLDPSSTEVALRVEKLCENITKALQQPWLSPQERQQAEAQRQAEEERRQQDAKTKRRLEGAEVEKNPQDKERRKLEQRAAWAGTKARALQVLRGKTAAGAGLVTLLLVGGTWLYRTATPADVTSAVVQPDKQTAENAKPLAKEATTTKAGALVPLDAEEEAVERKIQDALSSPPNAETPGQIANYNHEMLSIVAKKLRSDDGLKVGALGFTLANMSDDLRKRYNIKDTVNGVVITGVEANSSAADIGLLPGYVIENIEQRKAVASPSDVQVEIDRLKSEGRKSVSLVVSSPEGRLHFATLNVAK